jgi:hypothetical protein
MNIKELLEKQKELYWKKFNDKIGLAFECSDAEGILNDVLDWHKQSLIDFIENEIEEIKELRHEVQQDEMPLGNEQWKEGHTKCLNEVIDHLLSVIKEIKN